MTGRVYGLGVGPGDPELITLKALRLLRAVPVIAYPVTEAGESLARSIVAPWLPGGQTEIPIHTPMAERGAAEPGYDRAAEAIELQLHAGQDAAVLCEGDPFFYGSFMYLFARLAARVPVEVVPGVTSLTACAAVLGMPLASRNEVLTVLPAPLPDDQLGPRLAAADSAAIVKVGRHVARLQRLLGTLGLADRAWYVERATMAGQRILPLGELDPASATYFAVILVRKG